MKVAEQLIRQGSVKRSGRGHPKSRPQRKVGDKGYSTDKLRAFLKKRGIRYTIPRKSNEDRGGSFNKEIYRQRNRVERLINRLKQFRRIAARFS